MFERSKHDADRHGQRRVCETYPQVVQACIDSGWELNAHGYEQIPMHKVDDQRGDHREADRIVEKFWGGRRAAGSARA